MIHWRYLLLTLSMLVLSAAPARAHFFFARIVPAQPRGRQVELYFSDRADAGDPQFIHKLAHTKLWLQTKPGVFRPLPVRKGKDRLIASLPTTGSLMLVGKCTYGVLTRKVPFLLRHFPKAMVGKAEELNGLKPFKKIPLEIIGRVKGGKLHFVVLRGGKPLPHAKIYTLAKDLSGTRISCDAKGKATWQPPRAGWYMVYTSHFHKATGKYQKKSYEEIRDFATLSFSWPVTSQVGAAKK